MFIPHLIKYHQHQDLLREVTATLNEFMEMEEQIEANNDLEEKLDKEGAQELAREKSSGTASYSRLRKATKEVQRNPKKKYSADEKRHTSVAKKNGQKK